MRQTSFLCAKFQSYKTQIQFHEQHLNIGIALASQKHTKAIRISHSEIPLSLSLSGSKNTCTTGYHLESRYRCTMSRKSFITEKSCTVPKLQKKN